MKLRSVELNVEDVAAAGDFLIKPWGMALGDTPADRDGSVYLRGSGPFPYLIALHPSASPSAASVTFIAEPQEIEAIAARCAGHGIRVSQIRSHDPGGGHGLLVIGPEGERFRFLTGDTLAAPIDGCDLPVKLTHVVMNATDAEASGRFAEQVLGFKVSDRTRAMVFVRCNTSHHSIAFARAGYASLNHIAFEMQDVDAVMRGVGRLRDAELAPSWGPGRHGPGANVFAYFVAPFGPVVEFSSAVEIVPDDYKVGAPEDWTWPPNRIDQWGLSDKDTAALGAAERRFRFQAWAG